MTEEWRDVKGYEGLYQVSNLGRAKRVKQPKYINRWGAIRGRGELVLSPGRSDKGYYNVSLSKNKVSKTIRLHRLVLTHFKPNPLNLPEVNHIDGNKQNNSVDNLEWCTHKENINHSVKMGLGARGEKAPHAKLNELQVRIIRRLRGEISQREIGKIFGVEHSTICVIQRNHTWSHL